MQIDDRVAIVVLTASATKISNIANGVIGIVVVVVVFAGCEY